MGNDVQEFFDSVASTWDLHSEDKLPHLRELLSRLDIAPGGRILDLACGTGIITGELHDMFSSTVLGFDISEKMIELAKAKYEGREGIRFQVGDFFDESFDEKFDYIVCHNAFPHFLNVPLFVDRLYDCLKEGGGFVVFHSLGREKLKRHHDGLGPVISRDLEPVEIEAEAFAPKLEIVRADEGPTHFWIQGRK